MSQASPLHPLPLSTPSTEPAHSEGWRLYCFHPQGNRKPKSAWQQGDSKPSYRVWPAQGLAGQSAQPLAGKHGHRTGGSRVKRRPFCPTDDLLLCCLNCRVPGETRLSFVPLGPMPSLRCTPMMPSPTLPRPCPTPVPPALSPRISSEAASQGDAPSLSAKLRQGQTASACGPMSTHGWGAWLKAHRPRLPLRHRRRTASSPLELTWSF